MIRAALRQGSGLYSATTWAMVIPVCRLKRLSRWQETLLEADRAALELGLEALVQENELIVCACGGRDFVFLPELYAAETYTPGGWP